MQPFHAHVKELRRRVGITALFFAFGTGVGYVFRDALIAWVRVPLHQHLYYTSPSGALQFVFQVCLLVGIIAAMPIGVYSAIRFVEPAVAHYVKALRPSRWRAVIFVTLSYLLAIGGAAFAYYFVLPTALHFFAGFSEGGIQSMITADKYISFVINCVGVFAGFFQLPMILLFINFIRPIPPAKLRRFRKWVAIGSFAIALALPFAYDPVSQLMLAAPLIVLYEISIWAIWLINRKRMAQPTKAQRIAAASSALKQEVHNQPAPSPRPISRPRRVPAGPRPRMADFRMVPAQPRSAPVQNVVASYVPPRGPLDGRSVVRLG